MARFSPATDGSFPVPMAGPTWGWVWRPCWIAPRAAEAANPLFPKFLDHVSRGWGWWQSRRSQHRQDASSGMAQNGHGRHESARRACAPGRRCGRSREPAPKGRGSPKPWAADAPRHEALLDDPGRAAERYRAALAADHLPYHRITSTRAVLAGRPTAGNRRRDPSADDGGASDAVAGGWSVFWNELLIGAPPNRHRSVAAAVTRVGDMATVHTSINRWFEYAFDPEGAVHVATPVGPAKETRRV